MAAAIDHRVWCSTDRAGESISVSRPLPGVQLLSVVGSHRHWREVHEGFTVAVVHRNQGELVAEWRTRCRSLSTECGGIMSMEPGDLHVTERLNARRGVADFDVLQFAPELVAQASLRLGLDSFHFQSPATKDPVVFEALHGFVQSAARGDDSLSLECASVDALTALLTRLGESRTGFGQKLDPERDFRLRRVKEYLAAHLCKRPTLEELEAVSGLCRFRLCALFKRNYGMSPGQCWNTLRLRAAVRRLERGSTVKRIVCELGYLDESYFWRVFKSHYGVAPTAWLAMYRSNDRATRARARTR